MLNELETPFEKAQPQHIFTRSEGRNPSRSAPKNEMVDEDESSPWNPAALYSSGSTLFKPVKMSLKDDQIQAAIQKIEDLEDQYIENYQKHKSQAHMEQAGTDFKKKKSGQSKNLPSERQTNKRQKNQSGEPNSDSNSENEDVGEADDDLPKEAKEWRAHYYQDDLEILYDPVEDF